MFNYIKSSNAVFTTYGLNTMKDIISENNISNLNNGKIFLSSTPVDLNETKVLADFTYAYTFPVTSVENRPSSKVVRVQSIVPNDANNLDVRTIGLICVDENTGLEHLFAYASVAINKPSSSKNNYSLTLDINYNLSVINFDWNNLEFDVSDINYASMAQFINQTAIINTDIIALEHSQNKNSTIIGYNQPQVVYKKNNVFKEYSDNFLNVIDCINLENLLNPLKLVNNITDAYYNPENSIYSSYKLINVANTICNLSQKNITTYRNNKYHTTNKIFNNIDYNNTAYINVNNKIMTSNTDSLDMLNKTILIQCILGKDSGSMNILSKSYNNNENNIFSMQLQEIFPRLLDENNNLQYQKLKINNGFDNIPENYDDEYISLSPSQITISYYYNDGNDNVTANTILEPYQIAKLTKNINTWIIYCTLNYQSGGETIIPELHLIIDNEEITLQQNYTNSYINSIEPDNTTLYNYTIKSGLYTTYDNYIKKLFGINRILTTDEIYQLSLLNLNK